MGLRDDVAVVVCSSYKARIADEVTRLCSSPEWTSTLLCVLAFLMPSRSHPLARTFLYKPLAPSIFFGVVEFSSACFNF